MAIQDLTAIVPPPKPAVDVGNKARWKAIEKQLGTRFPADYFDFVKAYGSGYFGDKNVPVITPFNPFAVDYFDNVRDQCGLLESFRYGEGPDYIHYGIFPETPGLLPWATDINGNEYYWLTDSDLERWQIVVRSPDNEYEDFDEQLTSFLAKLVRQEITVEDLPDAFIDPRQRQFQPRPVVLPPDYSTIYELYSDNGDRADFWVSIGEKGVRYHVRLIDEKLEGRLPGLPVDTRPPVTMDVYFGDKLVETISQGDGSSRRYLRVDPPF